MAAISTAEVQNFLAAITGQASWSAPTGNRMLRLYTTANGSDTSAATPEVSGGSYTPQIVAWDAPSGRSIQNNGAVTFTAMPATTVSAVEVYDSTGTPRRLLWGPLTSPKTVDAGDTLTFADNSITLSVT
jgi:hypothetical protein